MATLLSQYCHPSFGLGNIAQPEVVGIIDRINDCETRIDAARDKLDAAIRFKRSLTMTLSELADMGIETESITTGIERANTGISDAAKKYVEIRLANENEIAALREELSDTPPAQMLDSPVDIRKSELVAKPLSVGSMKLDSQYFAFESNLQEDKLASIEKFIRSATGNIAARSGELSRSVCDGISDQMENHDVCGTLIVTVSCTHRNVQLLSPLVLDPDKAVHAWNELKDDKIDTTAPEKVLQALSDNSGDSISLISGTTYGSSFIGMAHLLRSSSNTMDNIDKLKAQLDKKLRAGGWLANASGEIGVDGSIMDEVRAFLSANSISCHITIVSMGTIPSIQSNELSACSYRLSEIDKVKLPSSDDKSERTTTDSEAEVSRQNALVNTVRNARISNILNAVSKSDNEKNKVLDINTLVDALDNYIEIIQKDDGIVGVPVGFYIRKFTKAEIARCWLKCYHPIKESENI